MEKVTQSTAASAEESAAASEELNAQAESTMADVARLETMAVGTLTAGVAHRTTARTPSRGPAGVGANLRKLPTKARAKPASAYANDEAPMAGTGTFGKF
jgi:hypothetical protein